MAKAVDYTKVQWQTFTDAVQNRNSYMAAAGNPKIMPKMNNVFPESDRVCFRNQTVCFRNQTVRFLKLL